MVFDSPLMFSAAALFGAGVVAWNLGASLKAPARLYLRFAAMLLAALAVCAPFGLGDVAALFLLPLSAACLALCACARFARALAPAPATLTLVAALACGLGAALGGSVILALLPVTLASLVIVAAALNRLAVTGALAGTGLLGAALACVPQGAGAGVLLFCAAALIGLARGASALAVEQPGAAHRRGAISLR
jgi:hypothetical protein